MLHGSLRAGAGATRTRGNWLHSVFTTARMFSSTQGGYASTLNNLRIGDHTRVMFQGFTGESMPIEAGVAVHVRIWRQLINI